MLVRIISSIVGLPILVAFMAVGGLPLKIAIAVMSIVGMYELYRALSKVNNPLHFIGYVFAVVYILFIDTMQSSHIILFCNLLTVTIAACLVFFNKRITVIDCAVTIFGFFYVAVLLTNTYLVRQYNLGEFFVWLIFISAWGSDTGAYFVGLKFGKHKLVPVLSPKKTVEGAIGGLIMATVLAAAYGMIVLSFYKINSLNIVFICAISGCIGSLFAQLGDLAASAIKRYTNIKDYGSLIPGHGGFLDRFDSVLFTAPGVYFAMLILVG